MIKKIEITLNLKKWNWLRLPIHLFVLKDTLCIALTFANAIINEIISILVVMLSLGIFTLDLDGFGQILFI